MASNVWTQAQITDWMVKTFGQPDNALFLIDHADEEWAELWHLTHTDDPWNGDVTKSLQFVAVDEVLEKIAEIAIVLNQIVQHLGGDLQGEISKKMVKNVRDIRHPLEIGVYD